MGKKMPNPRPRCKESESSSRRTVQSALSTIKLVCERALKAINEGNHNKALKIINELSSKHKISSRTAFIHQIQGLVSARVASIIGNPIRKQRLLTNAIESARKAVELSPYSMQYAQIYATLLYRAAKDENEYAQVVQECERALRITNPIDPAKQSFIDESRQDISTAEARILHVQSELRKLIQMSKKPPEEEMKDSEVQRVVKRLLGEKPEPSRSKRHGQVRKAGSASEKIEWIRSYWNSISIDFKKEFLRISISDLEDLIGPADTEMQIILKAVLSSAKYRKKWWVIYCCKCRTSFADSKVYRRHFRNAHARTIPSQAHRHLPEKVGDEWIEKILNCSWTPLDASAAVTMHENQSKCKYEETSSTEGAEVEGSAVHSPADDLSLSGDSVRAQLLEKIRDAFHKLIKHRYLATSHLSRVMKFAVDEIQGLASASQLQTRGLDQSPACICFLGESQLKKIFKLLLQLCQAVGLVVIADKSANPMEDAQNSYEFPVIKDKIDYDQDASCLLLDECLVTAEVTPCANESAAMADVITQTSSDAVLRTTDPFLSWILSVSSFRDKVMLCQDKIRANRCRGSELIPDYKKELDQLLQLADNKCERTMYEEALQVVQDLCLEEGNEGSCVSVLRKRKELIIKGKKDFSNRELDAIADVLKEAEGMVDRNQSGACDLESPMECYIETAIEKLKENLSEEHSIIDVKLMARLAELDRLEAKIEALCSFDFRGVLVPLVKVYLRETLEDLGQNDAMNKYDASRESILAELALDSEKGVKVGNDSPTHTGKTKNKKKIQKKRETRDLKATDGEQEVFDVKTQELTCSSILGDEHHGHDTTTSELLHPSILGDDEKHMLETNISEFVHPSTLGDDGQQVLETTAPELVYPSTLGDDGQQVLETTAPELVYPSTLGDEKRHVFDTTTPELIHPYILGADEQHTVELVNAYIRGEDVQHVLGTTTIEFGNPSILGASCCSSSSAVPDEVVKGRLKKIDVLLEWLALQQKVLKAEEEGLKAMLARRE